METQTHQITNEELFDWEHAVNLINFNKTVKRKSTGLTINKETMSTTYVTDLDIAAKDWQLVQ